MQELNFVSFEESRARKKAHAAGEAEKVGIVRDVAAGQEFHKRGTVHGHVRTGTLEYVESDSESHLAQDTLRIPFKTCVKGLRPSALDISPSDRAITIGCAFSPSTVSNYTRSPNSAITTSRSPPTIVVTPAKNSFSPSDLPSYGSHRLGYRPASSVYSRHTNCASRIVHRNAPPVPPLPLFINTSNTYHDLRKSGATTFEEDLTPDSSRGISNSARLSKPMTAGLPTPRRSKGWWNVITSPFSARSAHASFWRSPSPTEDRVPMLCDAQSIAGSDPHAGVIFTVRATGDEELRSAPACGPRTGPYEDSRPPPTRSETAPGALGANNPSFNIYRIPSQGEAAAYYNPNRHFPSLYLEPESAGKSPENELQGWSPSDSVYVSDSRRDSLSQARDMESHPVASVDAHDPSIAATPSGVSSGQDLAQAKSLQKRITFSTPSEDELKSPGTSKPQNERSFTQTTGFSMRSPMSATPIVQDAHLARFVGPQSSFGEQRTVDVERTPVPAGPPLATATMTHTEDYRGEWSILLSDKTTAQVKHTRENSYGLGISDANRELFPEQGHVSEKPRLSTEQRTVRIVDERKPTRPWYRRFIWYLIAIAAALVVLLVVVLAVYIPRKENGMTVEASWFNTTGYPAMSIGILTVVQPNMTRIQNSCVAPSDLWTCAIPGVEETSLPNFRLEITFRKGTLPKNETAQSATNSSRLVRRGDHSASPSVPSEDDQIFLGRSTDNSSAPYNGEETPFYVSLLDAAALQASSGVSKRDSDYAYPYPSSHSKSSNATTNSAEDIPPPNVKSNGQPADEVLYPLVTAQPLRLFNRGDDTEHYGFYTYFDRSTYISGNPGSSTTNSTDITSNVLLANASAVCTFSETRLLVQIWTGRGVISPLSPSNNTVLAANSTANDMTAPGSFPYPVTFKLDRHGGVSDKKGVYCYGIADSKVISDGKLWIEEDRAAGGTGMVNPAEVPGSNSTSTQKRDNDSDESSTGGIDGGDGGCSCQWQNW